MTDQEREFQEIMDKIFGTEPSRYSPWNKELFLQMFNEAYAKGRQSVLGDKIKNLDIEVLDKRIELSKKYGEQCEGATFDFYMWILSKLSDDKGG